MAGDPGTAILLMAMGFDSLSMSASNLLKIRKVLRTQSPCLVAAQQINGE
jgi:phosphotransferase system enzyme I (PtsP)